MAAAPEADILLDQLRLANEQLLSLVPDLDVPDLDAITQAIQRRGELVARVGQLLRAAGSFHSAGAGTSPASAPTYRAALEQALDAGELAVQRILSLRQTLRSKYVQLNRIQPGESASDPSMSYDM